MITNDEAFDALADLQRRQLLVRLLHNDAQSVPQLSGASREVLQAHETFLQEYLSGSQEIPEADKANIRAHHVHLPKLSEYCYIEWRRDAQIVTKGSEFDDVQPMLEVIDDRRDGNPARKESIIVRK